MLLGWIPSQRKKAMSQVALWSVVADVAGGGVLFHIAKMSQDSVDTFMEHRREGASAIF